MNRTRKFLVAGVALFLCACVGVGVAQADIGEINSVVRRALIQYGLIDENGTPIGGGGGSQTPWTSNIDAAGYAIINGGNAAFQDTEIDNLTLGSTLHQLKGSDAPSTGDMSSGSGNFIDVTGTTTIVTMSADGQAGTIKVLQFDGALTVTHGGSGEGAPFSLVGAVDMNTAAGDVLTVVYDGTVWREVSRSSPVIVGSSASISGVTSATVSSAMLRWSGSTSTELTSAQCQGQTYVVIESVSASGASFVLPAAPTQGDHVYFLLDDPSSALTVTASTGTKILTTAWSTATTGYVRTSRQGSLIHLLYVEDESSRWIATEITGTWAMDSTTSAGYAYTPTPWTSTAITHTWDADPDVDETCTTRRIGDMVECQVQVLFTGAPPASAFAISTIGSFTPDESKMLEGAPGVYELWLAGPVGHSWFYDASVFFATSVVIWYSEINNNFPVNTVNGTNLGTLAGVTESAPWTWATGDAMQIRFSFPVE